MPLPNEAAEQARQNRRKNQLDRRKVTPATRRELAEAIAAVDDPDARKALALMMEIVTGVEPQNTGDKNPGNGGRPPGQS